MLSYVFCKQCAIKTWTWTIMSFFVFKEQQESQKAETTTSTQALSFASLVDQERGGKRPWLRLITWPSTIWVAYLFPFYLQIYSANSLVSAWLYTRLPTTRRGLFHTFTVMLPFSPNLDPANSKKFLFPFWSITQTMFVNTWQFKARRTAVQNIETISRKSNRMISVAVPRPFSL